MSKNEMLLQDAFEFIEGVDLTKGSFAARNSSRPPYGIIRIAHTAKTAKDPKTGKQVIVLPEGCFYYKVPPMEPPLDENGEPLWTMDPETLQPVEEILIAIRNARLRRKHFVGGGENAKLDCESFDGVFAHKDNPYSQRCDECPQNRDVNWKLDKNSACSAEFEILGVDAKLRPVVLQLTSASRNEAAKYLTLLRDMVEQNANAGTIWTPYSFFTKIKLEKLPEEKTFNRPTYMTIFPTREQLEAIPSNKLFTAKHLELIKSRTDAILPKFHVRWMKPEIGNVIGAGGNVPLPSASSFTAGAGVLPAFSYTEEDDKDSGDFNPFIDD